MRLRPVVVACLAASLSLPVGVGATSASAAQREAYVGVTIDDSVISPNGDGVQDTTLGTLSLNRDTTYTSATWQLYAGASPVAEPNPIDLDTEGPRTFVVDPAAEGSELSDGTGYSVVVNVTAQSGETTETGSASVSLTLDTKPIKLTGVTLARQYVYPVEDRFFDELVGELEVFGDTVQEGIVEIIPAGGGTAAHSWNMRVADGETFSWDGRSRPRRMLPKGFYFAVVSSTDEAGNTATASSPRFGLHHNKLVHETMKRTVTAAKSMFADDSGRCSTVKKPGARGWKGSVGYYSQAKCKGSESTRAHVASARHLTRVPKAWSYGKLYVQAYGGATKSGSRHRGTLGLFTNNYELVHVVPQAAEVGWQRKSTTSQPVVFSDWVVVWWFATGYAQRYDVQKFRVTLPYKVLTKEGTAEGAARYRAASPFKPTTSRTSAEAGALSRIPQR